MRKLLTVLNAIAKSVQPWDESLYFGSIAKTVLLRRIAHELTDHLRRNITVDENQRESVRASLRLMVKRILRKYK